MPIAVQFDFQGGTLEQYDQVLEKLGLPRGGPGPAGLLFHWSAKSDDGLRVVDVWQSQEQFDTYAQQEIMPATQEVGVPQPQLQVFEVHNHLTAGS